MSSQSSSPLPLTLCVNEERRTHGTTQNHHQSSERARTVTIPQYPITYPHYIIRSSLQGAVTQHYIALDSDAPAPCSSSGRRGVVQGHTTVNVTESLRLTLVSFDGVPPSYLEKCTLQYMRRGWDMICPSVRSSTRGLCGTGHDTCPVPDSCPLCVLRHTTLPSSFYCPWLVLC